jgi:cell division protein FtsB
MTTLDRNRRFWFPFTLGLATMLFGGLLWRGADLPPPAYGQVPDSGAQRNEMIQQLRTTNQKLTEIVKLLTEIRDRQERTEPDKRSQRPQVQRPEP